MRLSARERRLLDLGLARFHGDRLIPVMKGGGFPAPGGGAATSAPGYQIDYKQITARPADITATTEATAQTIVAGNAVTYDGATVINITCFSPGLDVAASRTVYFCLYDGATSIGIWGYNGFQNTENFRTVTMSVQITPTAGAHTYTWKAFTTGGASTLFAGAGGVGNDMPAYIRITRV